MTPRRPHAVAALALAASLALPALAEAQLPTRKTLTRGWEVREQPAKDPAPQPAPPEEGAPEGQTPAVPPATPQAGASQSAPERWTPTRIPSVFDGDVSEATYAGEVRRYRLSFRAPKAVPGYGWAVEFEQVRRNAAVYLNGRRIGSNRDPYTPFTLPARGLKPGQRNVLLVVVDSRKDPRLPEGWWNWGGIVRPVHLVPVGRSRLSSIGTMSRVSCEGPARGCRASLLLDGYIKRRRGMALMPRVGVKLRSPAGRVTSRVFRFKRMKATSKRVRLSVPVPAPKLWSPERPNMYSARITLRSGGEVLQRVRRPVGLRSVEVKAGRLFLNNRPVNLRGASMHEDLPGNGAALSSRGMDRFVQDLKDVGANVTRGHYLFSERLLRRFDRAGIMVWNQAPIWQRDHKANLLGYKKQRKRAYLTVKRTVREARNHPSVITHSVANELTFVPDRKKTTGTFLRQAAKRARAIDPTLPISVDIKSRPAGRIPRQRTYQAFDMIGINQYFGWYRWVEDFNELEPYLREMHEYYPRQALVMTEFGAEGDPVWANREPEFKGGYAYQAAHADRTLALVDRLPFMSGAVYWTIREFEIFPGWTGGAPQRPGPQRNTRHHKGLLTYGGERKPAWEAVRRRFAAVPLYADER